MAFLLIGVAVLLVALAVVRTLSLHRRTTFVPQPVQRVFRNIRVLRDDEAREVARRACEREQLIAHAAERRAAHFGELTRPRGEATTLRAVANATPRDRDLTAVPK